MSDFERALFRFIYEFMKEYFKILNEVNTDAGDDFQIYFWYL